MDIIFLLIKYFLLEQPEQRYELSKFFRGQLWGSILLRGLACVYMYPWMTDVWLIHLAA